jgi:hypothetical protein
MSKPPSVATEKETIVLDGKKITFKKGALHRQLKVPEDEDIGTSNLRKIARSDVGASVVIKGKTFKVTPLMKKRAVFGLNISGKGNKSKATKKGKKSGKKGGEKEGDKSKTHSGEDYTGHKGNISKSKGKDVKKDNKNVDYTKRKRK